MSVPMEMITVDPRISNDAFVWHEANGVKKLVCEPLSQLGFANAFSTRLGGVSRMPTNDLNLAGFADDSAENIHENRRRFLSSFEGDWKLASCWQVHGHATRVVRDTDGAANDEERCDSLVTNHAGILVGVKTADCVPILLGDVRTGAVAAIHAGWRGTLSSIVSKTITVMARDYDTSPKDLTAAIGPAAGGCCYEVGSEVIDAFQNEFSYAGDLFTETK